MAAFMAVLWTPGLSLNRAGLCRKAPRAPSGPVPGDQRCQSHSDSGFLHFLQRCGMPKWSGRGNIAVLAQPHPPAAGNLVPIKAGSNSGAFLASRAASSAALLSEARTRKLLRWL